MRGHPDKKTIIKAILSEDENYSDILLHVSECEECRRRFNAIGAVLKSSDNSKIISSDDLEKRVVRSFQRIKHEETQKKSIFLFKNNFLKPLIVSVAMFFIVLSSFIIFKDQTGNGLKGVQAVLSSVKGTVTIDGVNAEPGAALIIGSVIKTDDQSIAEITFNKQFRIELAGSTIFSVEKTAFNENQNKYIFSFNLEKGTIYSEFYHNNRHMEYSFNTPDAVVYSIGTKFLLSAAEEKTDLFLTEGTLKIRSISSGEEIRSTDGKKYSIGSKITSREMTLCEKTVIEAIKVNRSTSNSSILQNNSYRKITVKQNAAYKSQDKQENINFLDPSDVENDQSDRENFFPGQKRRHRRSPHHPPPHHPPHHRHPPR